MDSAPPEQEPFFDMDDDLSNPASDNDPHSPGDTPIINTNETSTDDALGDHNFSKDPDISALSRSLQRMSDVAEDDADEELYTNRMPTDALVEVIESHDPLRKTTPASTHYSARRLSQASGEVEVLSPIPENISPKALHSPVIDPDMATYFRITNSSNNDERIRAIVRYHQHLNQILECCNFRLQNHECSSSVEGSLCKDGICALKTHERRQRAIVLAYRNDFEALITKQRPAAAIIENYVRESELLMNAQLYRVTGRSEKYPDDPLVLSVFARIEVELLNSFKEDTDPHDSLLTIRSMITECLKSFSASETAIFKGINSEGQEDSLRAETSQRVKGELTIKHIEEEAKMLAQLEMQQNEEQKQEQLIEEQKGMLEQEELEEKEMEEQDKLGLTPSQRYHAKAI